MEEEVLNFIFTYIKDLKIPNCDIYLNRPTIVGEKESRQDTYLIVSFPNGFTYQDAFTSAEGMITIGAKDLILGLPQVKEITRVSNIIKKVFPILTDTYSFINFEFSSDDSEGTGWHEYYYTFHIYIYINQSN